MTVTPALWMLPIITLWVVTVAVCWSDRRDGFDGIGLALFLAILITVIALATRFL